MAPVVTLFAIGAVLIRTGTETTTNFLGQEEEPFTHAAIAGVGFLSFALAVFLGRSANPSIPANEGEVMEMVFIGAVLRAFG